MINFRRKRRNIAAMLLAGLLTSGCTYLARGIVFVPQDFWDACKKEHGVTIYRTAENVKGYFLAGGRGCATCGDSLVDGDYQFVEAELSKETIAKKHNDIPRELAKEPGLYRFTLESRGHPNCAIFEEAEARISRGKGWYKFRETCIATWPIEHITARYAQIVRGHRQNVSGGKFGKLEVRVFDLWTGEDLLKSNYLTFYPRPYRGVETNRYCPRSPQGWKKWKLTDILKP